MDNKIHLSVQLRAGIRGFIIDYYELVIYKVFIILQRRLG